MTGGDTHHYTIVETFGDHYSIFMKISCRKWNTVCWVNYVQLYRNVQNQVLNMYMNGLNDNKYRISAGKGHNASKTHPKSGHKHRVVLEIRVFLE